jgi:hypothetical protein
MAVVDLSTRSSAAEVVLQPGDPCWYRHTAKHGYGFQSIVRAEFKSYGAVRCVVQFEGDVARLVDKRGGRRWRVVDPRDVFPRSPEE